MLSPGDQPVHDAYRVIVRIVGVELPDDAKALRVRSVLFAADHSVVGVRTTVVPLGNAPSCDVRVQLAHDAAARDAVAPKYFELTVVLVSAGEPAQPIHGAFVPSRSCDGTEHRVGGMIASGQLAIPLPAIALRGA